VSQGRKGINSSTGCPSSPTSSSSPKRKVLGLRFELTSPAPRNGLLFGVFDAARPPLRTSTRRGFGRSATKVDCGCLASTAFSFLVSLDVGAAQPSGNRLHLRSPFHGTAISRKRGDAGSSFVSVTSHSVPPADPKISGPYLMYDPELISGPRSGLRRSGRTRLTTLTS